MGNNSSTSRRDMQERVRSVFTSLRRMVYHTTVRCAYRRERGEDFEAFERLLSEDFLDNATSDSEVAEHLITIHVSCHEDARECIIYITGYNNDNEKVLEATVIQDLSRKSPSQCFVTTMQSGITSNLNFTSPYSATTIKTFCQQFSHTP